jgi:hypothetical protein
MSSVSGARDPDKKQDWVFGMFNSARSDPTGEAPYTEAEAFAEFLAGRNELLN